MTKFVACNVLLLFSFFVAVPGLADESESSAHAQESKNEIAAFLGLTHNGRRDNAGAIGVEYERRLSERIGIGALVEFTAGDSDFWVYAIPITFHVDRWKFVVAPGVEDAGGDTEKLLRLGAGYEFESSGIKITPSLNVDLVGGESVFVAGVSFGIGF